jgi:hypothetical protein
MGYSFGVSQIKGRNFNERGLRTVWRGEYLKKGSKRSERKLQVV